MCRASSSRAFGLYVRAVQEAEQIVELAPYVRGMGQYLGATASARGVQPRFGFSERDLLFFESCSDCW